MRTIMELFICGAIDDDVVLYHRTTRDISGCTQDPDRFLLPMLANLALPADREAVLAHSTSWRFDGQGIILTYLAIVPIKTLAFLPTRMICPSAVFPVGAAAPLQPRPDVIEEEHVVVHGLGHLRYLAEDRGDSFVLDALQKIPGAPVLSRFEPTVAGRLPQP